MTRRITPKSSLENLKREAKRWLKALRANAAEARARLERALPHAPAVPTLRDVQHALAVEHGVPGWSALKNLVSGARTRSDDAEHVAWFIFNACPDHHVRGARAHLRARHTAMRYLERYPEIAHDSFYTSIVCGDLGGVRRALAERPAAANEKGGPKAWEPLLYLCFTRLPLEASNDNAVEMARLLLDHGADPNVYFMAGDSRYTPLVGVFGEGEEDRPPHPHRDELARLLLERGAEPYDIQVVYNIHFHGKVLFFLQLIYERSLQLGRKADWDDPSWSMLDMGGYGNGARWHLDIAVDNDDLALAEWVLTHGASPNAPPARDPRFSQVSVLERAQRKGHTEMAQLLLRYGAVPTGYVPDDKARFMAACFRRDPEAALALATAHPELLRSTDVIFDAAHRDRADVVELLLDLGMSPDVEDEHKQRPLHMAAYANALRVAQLLIERGAAIDPVESRWSNTPLGGAMYAQHEPMIQLLSRYSRDLWELAHHGDVDRVREVLRTEPERAKGVWDGHTPLMWLAPDDEAKAIEVAKLLLAHGADPNLVSKDGESAADRAERLGMFQLAELLRSAMT
jgi:ankyrin repeat protein